MIFVSTTCASNSCVIYFALKCLRLLNFAVFWNMPLYLKKMQVKFGTAMSSHFSISDGVKQGVLFTIYINYTL